MQHAFAGPLNDFLAEINGLAISLPILMRSIGKSHKEALNNVRAFLEKNGILLTRESDEDKGSAITKRAYQVSFDHFYDLETLRSVATNFTAASTVIPRSFTVAMVSQFDAFLGRIIKAIYITKPELLNSSEKNISFSNLTQFKSIDDAREFIIEKEIESFLRESHAEQFEILERKLGMELRKGLDIWPVFIELTERRNLFVHTSGRVSSQYINVCQKHKIKLEKEYKTGDALDADPVYFNQSYNCLFEISTKLAQVLWRKLIPSELDHADGHLNSICYDLLKGEQYDLANNLLSFAVNLPRHSSQRERLVFVVNNAIALKWGSSQEEAMDLLSKVDWSACNDQFKIAVAAIEEKYDEAVEIMQRIGKDGVVTKPDYKDWPAFRDFRKTPEFLKTFQNIFGESLEVVELSSNDTIQLIDADENLDRDDVKDVTIPPGDSLV